MLDILSLVPGKKKRTSSGWTTFNCPCCHHRGHRQDRRMRAGIKSDDPNSWGFNCFNCNFSAKYSLGRAFSEKLRTLLGYLGVDSTQIQKWSLESLRYKDMLGLPAPHMQLETPSFDDVELEPEMVRLDINNPQHDRYSEYLINRGISPLAYPFLVSPDATEHERNIDRIVIPFTYDDQIVGWSSRYIDDKSPKYINQSQQGYVFNIDAQCADWQFVVVVEGIFDAIAIDGVGLLHNEINERQLSLIKRLNRRVIVVPDQDKSGMVLMEQALKAGLQVSIPNWPADVKDVADAVSRFGKVPTLLSIIQHATGSQAVANIQKSKISKKLKTKDKNAN